MKIHDVHCHFFSRRFFEALAVQKKVTNKKPVREITNILSWDEPPSNIELAKRWIKEMDKHSVSRLALMASIPGDESSVAEAVFSIPERLTGFFMLDPSNPDAPNQTEKALDELRLSSVCLFPAMHNYSLNEPGVEKIFKIVSQRKKKAIFVHCGALTVGVRKKLGLPSPFDMRRGNPLDLIPLALSYKETPIIIPHFGAGFFREGLMLADQCPNVYFDTSSSNGWIKYHPGLTLDSVFKTALSVLGPGRIIFGSDSSFFPRGWQESIWKTQKFILDGLGVSTKDQGKIFYENFQNLFPN